MTIHEGKQVTGSVQCCAINKCDCGKANMTVDEGKIGYKFSAVLGCKQISQ